MPARSGSMNNHSKVFRDLSHLRGSKEDLLTSRKYIPYKETLQKSVKISSNVQSKRTRNFICKIIMINRRNELILLNSST